MFSCCLNVSRDGEEVMSEGKSFHIHAPATGKVRRPTVGSLTAETNRLRGRRPKFLLIQDVSSSHEPAIAVALIVTAVARFPLSGKSGIVGNSVLTGMSGNCLGSLVFVGEFFCS